MSPLHLIPESCGVLRQSRRTISANLVRSLSSTADTNHPPSTNKPPSAAPSPLPQILDERALLSKLSPLKRIVCLCPVPLGRGRVSWSGGDSFYPHDDDTVDLSYRTQPSRATRNITQTQPLKVSKYRYGERFAIGVAVSDPYLTHARPVRMGGDGDDDDGLKRRFTAEIVPTFRCDAHNLGSSPIFHTNLPYFRNDFLEHINHFDIGAVVLALPMKQSRNPFCPTPSKVQLEQEMRLDQVRSYLLGVLQNYISVADDEEEDTMGEADDEICKGTNDASGKLRPGRLGPLNLQGCIDHRLSMTEVLSKTNDDCHGGSWDHISKSLREVQDRHTIGGGTRANSDHYFLGNREYGAHNVFSSVPPEIHAAVALNATMENYTGGFHNGFF